MVKLLLKLEMSLWINETRNSKEYMERILHNDFTEIGQSGSKYNKKDILESNELDIDARFPLEDVTIKEISDGQYLISYKINYKVDGTSYGTYRTSLWMTNKDVFQLYYHQGTKIL